MQVDVRDMVLIPGLGRSPGGGHGNPFQYSSWRIPWTEEPGGLWFIESQSGTRLKRLTTHAQTIEMPGAHSVPVLYPCRDLAVLPQEEATEETGMQS